MRVKILDQVARVARQTEDIGDALGLECLRDREPWRRDRQSILPNYPGPGAMAKLLTVVVIRDSA
ncbi:MAG: hypothetical protein ACE5Q3_03225 [Alphaproteobacteria bacterium]